MRVKFCEIDLKVIFVLSRMKEPSRWLKIYFDKLSYKSSSTLD